MTSKLIMRAGDSGAGASVIDAISEVLIVDVEDLTNIVLFVTQATDNGTVTLDVQISPDGTTWGAKGSLKRSGSSAKKQSSRCSLHSMQEPMFICSIRPLLQPK